MKTIIAACILTSGANAQLASTGLKRNRYNAPAGSEQPSSKKRRTNLRGRDLNEEKPFRLFSPIKVPGKTDEELSMSMKSAIAQSEFVSVADIEDLRETVVDENTAVVADEKPVPTNEGASRDGKVTEFAFVDQKASGGKESKSQKEKKATDVKQAGAKAPKAAKRRLDSAAVSMSLSTSEEPDFIISTFGAETKSSETIVLATEVDTKPSGGKESKSQKETDLTAATVKAAGAKAPKAAKRRLASASISMSLSSSEEFAFAVRTADDVDTADVDTKSSETIVLVETADADTKSAKSEKAPVVETKSSIVLVDAAEPAKIKSGKSTKRRLD